MAKKLDIVDYFKLYEKKWWEEGNKEEITVETIKDVGDIFGLNEAILRGKNKKVEDDDKGVNIFGSSEVSDVEDEDDDSQKIETLSILFRAVAELEVYNFDTILLYRIIRNTIQKNKYNFNNMCISPLLTWCYAFLGLPGFEICCYCYISTVVYAKCLMPHHLILFGC